jgi:hypothetical protein
LQKFIIIRLLALLRSSLHFAADSLQYSSTVFPQDPRSHCGAPRSAVLRSDRRTPVTGGGLPPVADLLAWNLTLLTYIWTWSLRLPSSLSMLCSSSICLQVPRLRRLRLLRFAPPSQLEHFPSGPRLRSRPAGRVLAESDSAFNDHDDIPAETSCERCNLNKSFPSNVIAWRESRVAGRTGGFVHFLFALLASLMV